MPAAPTCRRASCCRAYTAGATHDRGNHGQHDDQPRERRMIRRASIADLDAMMALGRRAHAAGRYRDVKIDELQAKTNVLAMMHNRAQCVFLAVHGETARGGAPGHRDPVVLLARAVRDGLMIYAERVGAGRRSSAASSDGHSRSESSRASSSPPPSGVTSSSAIAPRSSTAPRVSSRWARISRCAGRSRFNSRRRPHERSREGDWEGVQAGRARDFAADGRARSSRPS
jgi:hypothetical protein